MVEETSSHELYVMAFEVVSMMHERRAAFSNLF